MRKSNVFWKFWNWYILGKYHCDCCPYSWEERNYYEGDCDAGCFLKGEIADETCRYIRNPISMLKVRRARYLHSQSCCDEGDYFYSLFKNCEKVKEDLLNSPQNGAFYNQLEEELGSHGKDLTDLIQDISEAWDREVHPRTTRKAAMKKLISESVNQFIDNHIRCYFKSD